jgi:hypothetical protein
MKSTASNKKSRRVFSARNRARYRPHPLRINKAPRDRQEKVFKMMTGDVRKISVRRSRKRVPHANATAYHEAGHAVFCVYFGWKLRTVSIVPEGDAAGYVQKRFTKLRDHSEWNFSYPTVGRMLPIVMVLLAGVESQRKFNPRTLRSYQSGSDHQQAAHFLLSICSGHSVEAGELLAWLQTRTKNYVDLLWPPIQKFADVLLERKQIKGREATHLIKGFLDEGLA